MDFNDGYNGLILIGCIWAVMMALLFLTLFCVISQLPSAAKVKTKHGQVYPDIEISDGKDPGSEDDLPSVMLPCEQVRFDESLSGDNRYYCDNYVPQCTEVPVPYVGCWLGI